MMTSYILIFLFFATACGRLAPEIFMTPTEFIESKGLPCENHWVTTSDGYILNLIRIPSKQIGAPVVFLQHGLIASATTWLINLRNQSLAYVMADLGYDVWMGNSRGNLFSRNHTHLDPDKEEFWQFSWQEMAEYDIPASLNYIRTNGNLVQGQRIFYVGHSQGTLTGFSALSMNNVVASDIAAMFALAPIATLGHVESILRDLVGLRDYVEKLVDFAHHGEILSFNKKLMVWLALDFCPDIGNMHCMEFMSLAYGPVNEQLNKTRIPIYIAHQSAGTSVRDLVHFAQMMVSGKLQKFDFGSEKLNMLHYNQTAPPEYNLKNVQLPVALFHGSNDYLSNPIDVKHLESILPNLLHGSKQTIVGYNHMDFLWATDAPNRVYHHIIDLIDKIHNKY